MRRRQYLRLAAATCLAPLARASAGTVRFRPARGAVRVLLDSKPYLSFYFGPEWDRPFLHPLVTPGGIEISRGVPPKAGEDAEFPWQRGLWFGHADICGRDFWSGSGGRMLVSQPPVTDPRTASLIARAELAAAGGQVLGELTERFRFSGDGRRNIIDATISIAATHRDLRMGDTSQGGLAVRLTEEFRDGRGVDVLNSEGVEGVDVWGKPARWVDYSARVFGRKAGVAILDHPRNLRYPTRWCAEDYGMFAANPFGAGAFHEPAARGSNGGEPFVIRPGSELTLRYRVVVHEGDAEEAGIEAMQAEFAASDGTLE